MRSPTGNPSGPEIILIDDDPKTHEILKPRLLAEDLRVASYIDGGSAITAIDPRRVACILLNVDATDHTGDQIWKSIDTKLLTAPVLITSERHEISLVVEAIKKGAFDYLVKPFKADEVIQSIHHAIDCFRRHYPGREPLTPREHQVLAHIASGAFNKEMSRDLGISNRTIEVHRANIMRKLHARNAADLVRIALTGELATTMVLPNIPARRPALA